MVNSFIVLSVCVCTGFTEALHESHFTYSIASDGSVAFDGVVDTAEEAPTTIAPIEGDTISCSLEKAMKDSLGMSGGTTSIRGVFHDAMDHDNLLLKNEATNKWEPFELSEGHHYGGVDGCLYSALSNGDTGFPNPDHNRNIPAVQKRAADVCRATCNMKPNLRICKGPKTNGVSSNCIVDATILSANSVIGLMKGPDVPMLWGHRKGSCSYDGIVTPHVKFCKKACKAKYSQKPALRMAPSFTAIDDPLHFSSTFKRLGFDARDHVALMGAHTVGIIEPCAGGLNGVEIGPHCKSLTGNIPELTAKDLTPGFANGTCQLTHKHSCWRKTSKTSGYSPGHKHLQGKTTLRGFGDGGVWDRSPMRFDNDYFDLMKDSDFDGRYLCCGSTKGQITRFGLTCGRTGHLTRVTKVYNAFSYKYNWKKAMECYYHSGQWENKEPTKKLVGPFDEKWKAPKYKNLLCYDKEGNWINALNSTAPGMNDPMRGVHPADVRLKTTRHGNQICGATPQFCRDDRKGRTHMKAMNVWNRVPAYALKNAANHGNILRVVRLPGDWALLGDSNTKPVIAEFAADQSKFFAAFSTAWEKVLRKTHAPLETCSGEVDDEQVKKFAAQFKTRLSLAEEMQDSDMHP